MTFQPPLGFEIIRGRATLLGASDTEFLSPRQLRRFKTLMAEAFILALADRNLDLASKALDDTQAYLTARGQESARWWYVTSSAVAVAAIGILALVFLPFRVGLQGFLGTTFVECGFVACAGAFGALLSILMRIGDSPVDYSAGKRMNYLEGISRVAVGAMGAIIVTLAFELQLIFASFRSPQSPRTVAIAFLGIVAGMSERLVRDLIHRVEASDRTRRPGQAQGLAVVTAIQPSAGTTNSSRTPNHVRVGNPPRKTKGRTKNKPSQPPGTAASAASDAAS